MIQEKVAGMYRYVSKYTVLAREHQVQRRDTCDKGLHLSIIVCTSFDKWMPHAVSGCGHT